MSRIDELIQELCPEGVRTATLDELCEVANNKRKPVKSSLRISGTTPYYGANNIQDYVEGYTHDGEYVLIAEDGSASLLNYSVQFAIGKFWANNHVHVVRGKDGVDNRFLFHFFGAMNFRPYLTGGTRAKLNKSKLLEIKIPIPPLEVQKEIASILDKLTQLEAELSAELDARRKQYEYYRRQLLEFDESTRKIKLEYVADIGTGSRNGNEALPEGKYPLYVRSQDVKAINSYSYDEEAVIIPGEGGVGEIFHYVNGKYDLHQRAYRVHLKDRNYSNKFLYYYMKTYFKKFILKKAVSATVTSIRKPMLLDFEIPVLPLEDQERIVATLDTFDALVNSVNSGLPAEIAARHKQYEYYRTKLLTFQELPA